MTYLRTEKIKNGELFVNFNVYECDRCTFEIPENHSFKRIKDIHICDNCVLELSEYIIKHNIGGMMLFWLEEMKYRYFKNFRKKRNSYLPKKLRNEILKKYKFKCQECSTNENLTIDHIKPVSKGGTDESTNLTVLCKSCNSRKGAKYED